MIRNQQSTPTWIVYTVMIFLAQALFLQESASFTISTVNTKSITRHHFPLNWKSNVLPSLFSKEFLISNDKKLKKTSSLILFAKKKTKKSNRATRNKIGKRTASASGFGGAAVEDCPCSSGLGYMKCCGKLHKNPDDYASATPEQVVRARYSAYAKREVDFIIGSTHPLNENNFMTDIDHWRETIRTNCYDNFELTNCTIISESLEGEGENQVGMVKFIASMIQVDSREKTSFMETSKFERAGKHIRQGAWLYKDGVVESVPGSEKDEEESDEVEKSSVSDSNE